jgi:hypothetical protein
MEAMDIGDLCDGSFPPAGLIYHPCLCTSKTSCGLREEGLDISFACTERTDWLVCGLQYHLVIRVIKQSRREQGKFYM